MIFKILCIGKLKDKNYQQRIEDYFRKLSFDAKVSIQELKDSNKEKEGQAICQVLDKEKGLVIAMTEEGKAYTSRGFANLLNEANQKIIFVIGGPDGISDVVKKRANRTISLSKMTFTHEMARLFLSEQIFRAVSIIKGRKYHND